MASEGITIVGPAVEGNSGLIHLPNFPVGAPAYGEEGVHWVHGCVTEDDDAGRALLAAFALNRDEPDRHAPVMYDFVKKTYEKFYTTQMVP